MKPRLLFAKLLAALALLACAMSVHAQDGLEGAALGANVAATRLAASFGQQLATADFDGDHRPDGAVLIDDAWLRPENTFRTIQLHFTGRRNVDLTFESTEVLLAISAVDVNRDGATDIVVEQPFTHKRLQVWLNDGRGNFRKANSEDFPYPDMGNRDRLESPLNGPNAKAFCLPSQRDSKTGVLTAYLLPYPRSSACSQAVLGLPITWLAVAPNPSRAPPLSSSL